MYALKTGEMEKKILTTRDLSAEQHEDVKMMVTSKYVLKVTLSRLKSLICWRNHTSDVCSFSQPLFGK